MWVRGSISTRINPGGGEGGGGVLPYVSYIGMCTGIQFAHFMVCLHLAEEHWGGKDQGQEIFP